MDDDERDRLWMAAWRDGDERGGDRLTQAYFELIRRYFVRRAPDEYEDLVQHTFLELARSRDNYLGEGTVRAFLFGIARNVYLRYLCRLSRRQEIDTFRSSAFDILGRRLSSVAAERQEHRVLIETLKMMPIDTQELLQLYYWQQISVPEIRTILELDDSEAAIHGRLHRARVQLRSALLERGVTHSDAEIEALLQQTRGLA